MLSAEVLACADLCLRRVGTLDFGHEVAKSAAGGTGRERQMAAKLAWVDNRIEFHCQHWKLYPGWDIVSLSGKPGVER